MDNRMALRLSLFRKQMADLNIDTMVVQTEENRRYLSGYTGEDGNYDESAGALLITEKASILATDSRFVLQAQNETTGFDVYRYEKGLPESLPELLRRLNTKRMGFEANRISHSQFKKIRDTLDADNLTVDLVGTEHIVDMMRAVKDEAEIQTLKQALSVAESVFEQVVPNIEVGESEKEIAWKFEKGMRESGAQDISFPVIVASGPNSALPHAVPGDRRIQAGEPILIDWGAKLDGYCSDITRTFTLGKTDEWFQKVFQTVYEANVRAVAAIKPGASTKTIDAIARNYIADSEFKGRFGHSLGHGTGLAIHEYPRLSQFYEKPLQPGMVVTVEPGIYIPDWGGIRLENMIVVREDGAEVLNRLALNSRKDGSFG